VRARAPASSANLGPGFDVLALALGLYVEVTARPSRQLIVRTEGEGAEVAQDESHLAAAVAIAASGHDHWELTVRSQIPLGRGLGSSGALSVAAAAAAGAGDPLGVAASLEGHAENAAASLRGGLVAATLIDGAPIIRRLPLDPLLGFVVLVPDRQLPTEQARAVVAREVSLADAVFNLGRLGLLLAGLADRTALTPASTGDRLHQEARSALFPEARELLARLVVAGALASCWSGAGPSLLAICRREDSARIREAGEAALEACSVPGRAMVLEPDHVGLVAGAD
jgi:homoserine kinase